MDGRETRLASGVSSVASKFASATDAEPTSGAHVTRQSKRSEGAGPVVEISDKDYRSFGLPCDVLEETHDSEQEK